MGQQSETSRIASLFEQAFDGSPYYGPSILNVLGRITASTATFRLPNSHSIWELVAHMASEINYSSAVLDGDIQPWVEGETTWPKIADVNSAAWDETVQELRVAYRELVRRIRAGQDSTLGDRKFLPVERTIYEMLHGTLQHTVYHTGQIQLMLKANGR